MRVVVYSRVSTDAQERDGTSLATQERACLEFAQQSGWLVIDAIRDSASGYTLERPGLARVRQFLRDGAVDVVLAYAVDRLSRSQTQIGVMFEDVSQADARFEFVTEKFEDTAVGRLILSVRAFAAEIEREKISERTMRGKLERAKSGRIPQAFGLGCYGYVYNAETGQREIEPFQAEIVRRMFRRYAETRSFAAVSNELNADGVTAFQGGKWYPITIRQTLTNESYTGHLFYRRTRSVVKRGPNGKRRRSYVERPADEWVEIEGASPQIVDDVPWQRVQAILTDPARVKQRSKTRSYPLRGRLRCGLCGSAMVGQTMKAKNKEYRYYGCRHVYDRTTGHDCQSRYVRGDALEEGIWREVRQILTNPGIVFDEITRRAEQAVDTDQVAWIEKEISSLTEREKRLVRLYTFGEIDETVIRDEGARVRDQRARLEQQLASLQKTSSPLLDRADRMALERLCSVIGEWVDRASEAERTQILEALQITITATREQATISGVLPVQAPEFFIEQYASA